MSHNFRAPASIDPQARRDERRIELMATYGIPDQAALDKLLDGTAPAMRTALIERLTPYLMFAPETAVADCPNCGLRRGSAIDHACSE